VKYGNPSGTASTHSPTCPTPCNNCDDCWFQCTADDILTAEKKNFLLGQVIPDMKGIYVPLTFISMFHACAYVTACDDC
jgi:hypothetical protein